MRRYVISGSAGLGLFMYAIDSTAVAVAFPNFISDFGTNVLWAGWTISIYLVAITSIMALMGNLSDSLGRKKIFLISLILFTASSLACGLAPNIHSLVVFRFFQGVGGALGISSLTIILHLSSTPAMGFRIAFISFGLILLFTISLVFLMPAGKKERG